MKILFGCSRMRCVCARECTIPTVNCQRMQCFELWHDTKNLHDKNKTQHEQNDRNALHFSSIAFIIRCIWSVERIDWNSEWPSRWLVVTSNSFVFISLYCGKRFSVFCFCYHELQFWSLWIDCARDSGFSPRTKAITHSIELYRWTTKKNTHSNRNEAADKDLTQLLPLWTRFGCWFYRNHNAKCATLSANTKQFLFVNRRLDHLFSIVFNLSHDVKPNHTIRIDDRDNIA